VSLVTNHSMLVLIRVMTRVRNFCTVDMVARGNCENVAWSALAEVSAVHVVRRTVR